VGVQTDEPLIDEAIRTDLGSHLVDGLVAEPNLALVLSEQSGERSLVSLHCQGVLAGRSASAAHIRRLLSLLAVGLASRSNGSRLWLQAWSIGGPNGVVLVGPDFVPALTLLSSSLERRDWRLGGCFSCIDLESMEVVVDRSAFGFPEVARFDQLSDWPHSGPGQLDDGRYPLRALALVPQLPPEVDPGRGSPNRGLLEETRLLSSALPLIGGLESYGVGNASREIRDVARRVPVHAPGSDALLAWLVGLLECQATR
jgi:hypothetical protein